MIMIEQILMILQIILSKYSILSVSQKKIGRKFVWSYSNDKSIKPVYIPKILALINGYVYISRKRKREKYMQYRHSFLFDSQRLCVCSSRTIPSSFVETCKRERSIQVSLKDRITSFRSSEKKKYTRSSNCSSYQPMLLYFRELNIFGIVTHVSRREKHFLFVRKIDNIFDRMCY